MESALTPAEINVGGRGAGACDVQKSLVPFTITWVRRWLMPYRIITKGY